MARFRSACHGSNSMPIRRQVLRTAGKLVETMPSGMMKCLAGPGLVRGRCSVADIVPLSFPVDLFDLVGDLQHSPGQRRQVPSGYAVIDLSGDLVTQGDEQASPPDRKSG